MMDRWAALWISWGITGLLIEIFTLLRPKYEDTLSENIWKLLSRHPLIWFVSLGLTAWAIIHLFGPSWTLPY